jgi:hypothetical protein
MIGQLFRQPEFTREDWIKLAQSNIFEVREGTANSH